VSDAAAKVARARAAGSSAESEAIYAEWAASYDDDVFGALGFTGSDRIADLLAFHVDDRSLPVLDLGCGTGRVGERLRWHGFTAVDGIDISPEMLAMASLKGAYRRLDAVDLTAGGALPASGYAASVSAGTFTSGHVGARHLGAITAAHRAGAIVAWVIAQPLWADFEPALAGHGFEVITSDLEPVRAGGPPESVMLVARLRAGGPT
jgi:SAM-dependent methyltransferase